MHERRIIYEVYNPQRCMGPYLNKSDADKAIVKLKRWATREGTLKDFAPTVREAEVECEIRAGEILGVLDGSETCHLIFQKPCGEWSSEDVDEKTAYADEFILHSQASATKPTHF